MLEFTCPHCNYLLKIPENYAGQSGTCNKCGKSITAPQLEHPNSAPKGIGDLGSRSARIPWILKIAGAVLLLILFIGIGFRLLKDSSSDSPAQGVVDSVPAQSEADRLPVQRVADLAGQSPVGTGPRILVLGDSWAWSIGDFKVFEQVLARRGLSRVSILDGSTSGATAAQIANNQQAYNDVGILDRITNWLTTNPTIDIVHITLGGNDLSGVSMETSDNLTKALESIADDIDIVVDHIHSVNPNIRVAWAGYDYVGSISMNPAVLGFVPIAVAHAAAKENYWYINTVGNIHHRFGFPGKFGPGETPVPGGHPQYDPAAGGDPSLPQNPEFMEDDAHLTRGGYVAYIERCFDEFYSDWLLED